MQSIFRKRVERIAGPLPRASEARAISVIALAAAAILCGLSIYYGARGETFMGRPLGTDFVEFYSVGKILNSPQPARIYDIPYLSQVEHASLPTMPATQMLIFGNAPYVGWLFRPLALLPYFWAYCVWLVISVSIYSAGLYFLLRNGLAAGEREPAFLLALSAPMFTLETWIGGQISVLSFLAIVGFARGLRGRKEFLAGAALGLALFKPSLVVVPAAMLLIGAFWRALAGFCLSGAVSALLSVAAVGVQGCRDWLVTLRVFQYLVESGDSVIRRTKYVDLNSFFALLLPDPRLARALAAAIGGAGFLMLAWAWWRARAKNSARSRGDHFELWSATLAWGLAVNVYVPVYNTISLIPACALAAWSLKTRGEDRAPLQVWLAVLYVIPWITQSLADLIHLQILTIVLAGFGYWALRLSLRESVPSPSRELALGGIS